MDRQALMICPLGISPNSCSTIPPFSLCSPVTLLFSLLFKQTVCVPPSDSSVPLAYNAYSPGGLIHIRHHRFREDDTVWCIWEESFLPPIRSPGEIERPSSWWESKITSGGVGGSRCAEQLAYVLPSRGW